MSFFPIEALLFAFLLVIAFVVARLRDLFAAGMLTGIFSLLSAGLFVLMDAVDVAFTEAAVGAGMSTVLFLATLSLTGATERAPSRAPGGRAKVEIVSLAIVMLTGVALLYATLDMPPYGDPAAPIHHHVVPRYLEDSMDEIGVPNVVTSVLASYRGYDTFGELTVIFTAGISVMLLLGSASRKRERVDPKEPSDTPLRAMRMREKTILRITAQLLVPLMVLFALYVQAHGDLGPGGGFQAGVIFAAAFILHGLIFGPGAVMSVLRPRLVEFGVALGVIIYGGVGVVALALGGAFLDYSALDPEAPTHGQHLGIFLVELGVGITVMSVMLTIYYYFAGSERT